MTKISRELSKWREYFGSTNLDIFDIIDYGIRVAVLDHPEEFKLRRDKITELLYSFSGIGSDEVELVLPNDVDVEVDKGTRKSRNEFVSCVESEALIDEMEEQSRLVKEVLSIKKIIDNSQDESDSNIYKSLKRLQLMDLSVETLQDTVIGKSVNALKGHNSKNIQYLAKTMIKDWMYMVKEWMDARAALRERTPESMKAHVADEEEEVLPSPPLEDLPFVSTPTTSIQLSQFFDGMDDDGNLVSSAGSNKNHGSGQKDKQQKKETSLAKLNKPPGGNSGRGRPAKPTLKCKLNNDHEMKLQQKSDKSKIQMRPVPNQQNKLKCLDEDTEHVRLEATKRKLQESYQEAENAKRLRATQVVKLHDIPKQCPGVRNPHMRPGSHNKPVINRRQ